MTIAELIEILKTKDQGLSVEYIFVWGGRRFADAPKYL